MDLGSNQYQNILHHITTTQANETLGNLETIFYENAMISQPD